MGKGSIGYFLVLIYVDFLNFVLQSTFGHSEKGGDNLWATAKLRSSPSRMSTFGDFTGAPDQTKLFGPKFCQSFEQTRKEIVLSDSSIEPFKIWIFSTCGYLKKKRRQFFTFIEIEIKPWPNGNIWRPYWNKPNITTLMLNECWTFFSVWCKIAVFWSSKKYLKSPVILLSRKYVDNRS